MPRGNHPPVPTCLFLVISGSRLSSVSRSRGRSEEAVPCRTFTLLRIAVGCPSHTLLVQRGSVLLYVLLKHSSRLVKCQPEKSDNLHEGSISNNRLFLSPIMSSRLRTVSTTLHIAPATTMILTRIQKQPVTIFRSTYPHSTQLLRSQQIRCRLRHS